MIMKTEQIKIVISLFIVLISGILNAQNKECYFFLENETKEYKLYKEVDSKENVIRFYIDDKMKPKRELDEVYLSKVHEVKKYLYNPLLFNIHSMYSYKNIHKILDKNYCTT